jgi:hypothetical protein
MARNEFHVYCSVRFSRHESRLRFTGMTRLNMRLSKVLPSENIIPTLP